MEAVIFIGVQGSGKSTFYRERFLDTHVRVSLDLLKTRPREQSFLETCIRTGQRFVIDNTNPRAADRADYIAAAKRAGFRVVGYFFETTLREALKRNNQREGPAVIPVPGVIATLKRLEHPTAAEGFDELHRVTIDENDHFQVSVYVESVDSADKRHRIFLLSPANANGERAKLLLRPAAQFDLAVRLRRGEVKLGEAFAFISGLYFRGKLAYAQAFATPPPGVPGSFVITAGQGLVPPETPIRLEHIEQIAAVPIDADNPDYRLPLERDCRIVNEFAGENCEYVLLGSVATVKYSAPLTGVFGDRLLFPEEFIGRGDMSRGGLMLRCVEAGAQLTYVPLGTLTRHGVRPPRLPPLRRR